MNRGVSHAFGVDVLGKRQDRRRGTETGGRSSTALKYRHTRTQMNKTERFGQKYAEVHTASIFEEQTVSVLEK